MYGITFLPCKAKPFFHTCALVHRHFHCPPVTLISLENYFPSPIKQFLEHSFIDTYLWPCFSLHFIPLFKVFPARLESILSKMFSSWFIKLIPYLLSSPCSLEESLVLKKAETLPATLALLPAIDLQNTYLYIFLSPSSARLRKISAKFTCPSLPPPVLCSHSLYSWGLTWKEYHQEKSQ